MSGPVRQVYAGQTFGAAGFPRGDFVAPWRAYAPFASQTPDRRPPPPAGCRYSPKQVNRRPAEG